MVGWRAGCGCAGTTRALQCARVVGARVYGRGRGQHAHASEVARTAERIVHGRGKVLSELLLLEVLRRHYEGSACTPSSILAHHAEIHADLETTVLSRLLLVSVSTGHSRVPTLMSYGTCPSAAAHDEAASEQEPASPSTWRVIMKTQVLRGVLVFALFCAVLVSSGQRSSGQVALEELARVGERGSPEGHGKAFRVLRVTKGIGKRG